MTSIVVAISVMGMSGKFWQKRGTFDCPVKAADFIISWWSDLSKPEDWILEINDEVYSTDGIPINQKTIETHIRYCLDMHESFCDKDHAPS